MTNTPPEYNTNAAPAIPHSREAEEAVIGSVMINPDVYLDVKYILSADDFYIHRLKWIFETFDNLHENDTPIDLLTVSNDLSRQDRLSDIGGAAYLTTLLNQVPTSLNAEHYARIISGYSTRRGILTAANDIATLAYNEEEEDIYISESYSWAYCGSWI